jgi:hypothetical protein
MHRRKEALISVLQMRFTTDGNLEAQLPLTKLMRNLRTLSGQTTLDIWLSSTVEKRIRDNMRNEREETFAPTTLAAEIKEWDYTYDYSITDEHVKEDQEDIWDGSLDNQERILEDHVSKYGWHF